MEPGLCGPTTCRACFANQLSGRSRNFMYVVSRKVKYQPLVERLKDLNDTLQAIHMFIALTWQIIANLFLCSAHIQSASCSSLSVACSNLHIGHLAIPKGLTAIHTAVHHMVAAQGHFGMQNQTGDLPITRHWLYPWATTNHYTHTCYAGLLIIHREMQYWRVNITYLYMNYLMDHHTSS